MAKKGWHEQHPGGGSKAQRGGPKQPRITQAEQQQAANQSPGRTLTPSEAREHPGHPGKK